MSSVERSMIVFTKDEIKEFLVEQGFDVSDEAVLNKFIHDLKKLIKYEEMKKRRRRLGHPPDETVLDSTGGSSFGSNAQSSHALSGHQSPKRHYFPSPKKAVPRGLSPSKSSNKNQSSGGSSHQQQRQQSASPSRSRSSRKENIAPPSQQRARDVPDSTGGSRRQASAPTLKSKKAASPPRGNRMIMKRVTAGTDENGEATIYQSNVDLGIARRPQAKVHKVRSRPETARPTSARRPPQAKPSTSARSFRDYESVSEHRPFSADNRSKSRSRLSRSASRHSNRDPKRCGSNEPDELYYVLKELMFPGESGSGSEDSLYSDETKKKKMIMPPRHVAIDPVALYHWYKKYNWDVLKVPGEERHMKLRWNVRAKTVGGFHPCV